MTAVDRAPTHARQLGWLPGAAFAVAVLGVWLLGRGMAGREDPWLLVAIGTALPLYALSRGWRLPWWLHAVAAALPLSILLLALVHGYPEGAAKAARYGYAALLVIATAAWATTPRRRAAVALAGAVLAVDQYIAGWYWWWGRADPTELMQGMFGWHNQFAVYCAIGGVLAAVLAITGKRVVMIVAYIIFGLTTAGVTGSGSRAVLAMYAAVMLVVLLIAVVVRRWRGVVRWVLLMATGVGTMYLMLSPVFFPGSETVPLAAAARGNSLQSSGGERLEFWRVGFQMGLDHWLTGVGNSNYGPMNLAYGAGAYSSHPHNELVLAWAEGGLVGALPLLAVYVGAVWLVLRSVLRPLPGAVRRVPWLPGRAELAEDPGRWAGVLALVLAIAHSLMDFDWAWPSILALVGIVGGLALAPLTAARGEEAASGRAVAIVNATLVIVVVVAAVTAYLIDPLRLIPAMPVGGWPVVD